MTRLKISTSVLIVLASISVISWLWAGNSCKVMTSDISHIEQLIDSGNYAEALACSGKLERKWQSFRKKASVMIKNSDLSETDQLCAGINLMIKNHSRNAVYELEKMRHMLENIRDSERPALVNIF